ncbi:PREDICTED: squalene epoxidase 4 [Camelina sativa]|uniref:Squalene monooxygenase n=1 Tax=Camelina sativa TaxID=90675 RepID=A0ABM0T5M7_CAMSA|nr:PREDICTED: squalene epoxidase 4 [Camelina sativa]
MTTTYAWLWTLFAFVLTWMVFHLIKTKKAAIEEAEAKVEERRDGATDVIIVGAGIAGASLAYALAKDGRRVHVIERDLKEPQRFMGELMQAGGRLMLAQLGLEDCLEEIDAQEAKSLAIYKDGEHATLPFPNDKAFPLEPVGRLLRNGRFVQRLRQKAASLTNVQLEEGTVKSLIEEKGVVKGVTYKNSAGEETTVYAPLTVVCDGCYSNLRRSLVDNTEEVLSYMVGYVTKNSRLEDPKSLHLIFSKPLVCVIYQITSDEVRCVAEVPADSIPSIANGEMSAYLKKTMAPQIPERGNLRDIFLKGIEEGLPEIKTTATKSMSSKLCDKRGVIVLGDAFNMRHPIIASGMMVALSDICILRNLLRPLPNLGNTKKVSDLVKSFYIIRKPMSATVNTLGSIFSQVLVATTDEAREGMRQGCYNYLSRGDFKTTGLMTILGGMNPHPLTLVIHLVAITLTSMGHLLYPFPSPRRFWHSLRILAWALQMLGAHLVDEGFKEMLIPTNAATYRRTYIATATV